MEKRMEGCTTPLVYEGQEEECEHERSRCDDGIWSCLDCGDRYDLESDDDE